MGAPSSPQSVLSRIYHDDGNFFKSSSDGTKLAAVVNYGNIWTSTDSGATWTEITSTGDAKYWYAITSSGDGTKLAATVDDGNIWTSTDSGATWTEITSTGDAK